MSSGLIWRDFNAYVHFPFCRHLCSFCGYETRLVSHSSAKEFSSKLLDEISYRLSTDDFSHARLNSLFFGGGTASLIPESDMIKLLEVLQQFSRPAVRPPEITLECEPGTIGLRKLKSLQQAGVNRISVCAQSLNNADLKWLGRRHTREDVLRLIDHCGEAGIENIHVDLIFGLPCQSLDSWLETLEEIKLLPVRHVSTYKLYVYKHGTLDRYGLAPRAEEEPESLTEKFRSLYDAGVKSLRSAGMEQYSLTEFSFPDSRSEYVQSCFNGADVLPIGPGAFGRGGYEVWENCPYINLYGANQRFNNGRAYLLERTEAFKRDVLLGLWLLSVDVQEIASRHGVKIGQRLIELLETLAADKMLEFKKGRIALPPESRFHAGAVMQKLSGMSTGHWGHTIAKSAFGSLSQATLSYPPAKKFGTLFRMARRDAELYNGLKENPEERLSHLGFDVKSSAVNALISVIQNGSSVLSDSDMSLQEAWKNLEREHEQKSANNNYLSSTSTSN